MKKYNVITPGKENRRKKKKTVAAQLQYRMIPRPTEIEKVNKKVRKMKDMIERRRRTRRQRKQSEENT